MEGGDALAQGFYRGFTGLVSKPLQGAKTGVGGRSPCLTYSIIHGPFLPSEFTALPFKAADCHQRGSPLLLNSCSMRIEPSQKILSKISVLQALSRGSAKGWWARQRSQ